MAFRVGDLPARRDRSISVQIRAGASGTVWLMRAEELASLPPARLRLVGWLGHGVGVAAGTRHGEVPVACAYGTRNGLHSRPRLLVQTTETRVDHEYYYVIHATYVQRPGHRTCTDARRLRWPVRPAVVDEKPTVVLQAISQADRLLQYLSYSLF